MLSPYIPTVEEQCLQQAYYDPDKLVVRSLFRYLKGEDTNVPLLQASHYHLFYPVFTLFGKIEDWGELEDRAMRALTQNNIWARYSVTAGKSGANKYLMDYYFMAYWFNTQYYTHPTESFLQAVVEKLKLYEVTEIDFLWMLLNCYYYGTTDQVNGKQEINSFGKFILSHAKKDFMLVKNIVKTLNKWRDYVLLIAQYEPQLLQPYLHEAIEITVNYNNEKDTDLHTALELLKINPTLYEPYIVKAADEVENPATQFNLYEALATHFPQKYKDMKLEKCYLYLQTLKKQIENRLQQSYFYHYEETKHVKTKNEWMPISYIAVKTILQADKEKGKTFLQDFLPTMPIIQPAVLEALSEELKEKAATLLLKLVDVHVKHTAADYYKVLFNCLSRYDYSEHEAAVWELTKHKSKKLRSVVAVTLGKLGEKSLDRAIALINDKKADARQTGALILSLIGTPAAVAPLADIIEKETNDEARDIILQTLGEKLPQPQNETDAKAKIKHAEARGKLGKPIVKWLDDETLTPPKWLSGENLDLSAMRFLLYRQNRSKTMASDVEAKPIIALMDKKTSEKFALELLNYYVSNGEDTKYKAILALAGVLGGDKTVDYLKTRVKQLCDQNRGKMAEYVVQALALNGSLKALRAVEEFSRKYKNKNRNVGAAALSAFGLAAEEQGITPFELGDKIIPDFGFEGIYKHFMIKEASYRAFIDNDFKIKFFDEENKVLKTLPKGASAELKEEFKELGKEVRDIVRSQSNRMEYYLVTQRRWSVDKWTSFFMQNPIMFVYALKIIWGLYDEKGTLTKTFRAMEDLTLSDIDFEEMDLDEVENQTIGMVHPLSLSEEDKQKWVQYLEDDSVELVFPQLNRPVVKVEDVDKEVKFYDKFNGKKVEGLAFKGQMDKLGWQKGSVVDGGMVSSYRKSFTSLGMDAVIETEGIYMGWDDYDPELGRLYFVRTGSIKTGSYTYDEPSNSEDARLFKLGDVPAIIFSEVMADLQRFAKEEKKEAV